MLIELFLIGLVVGFIYYEWSGISPGGVIAPAYFALFINQPLKIVNTLLLAVIIYFILRYLSARLILYGRRRLLLALLLSFLLKMAVSLWLQPALQIQLDLQSIGYIIPGLIANEMLRQKVVPTILSLGIVTLFVTLLGLVLL